jgi:hypothetical protein
MKNIEQYRNRFNSLLESTMGDVRPLISEVATNPLHELIGKTVKFEPISIERVTGEDYPTDEWSFSELESEAFSNTDASYWDLFKTEPIKAKIKGVKILTDDVILFLLEDLDNIALSTNVTAEPSFQCGKDTFHITLTVASSNTWFANKKVHGTFRNVKLAEYLNNNLPCGGFDFVKIDSEETPTNFA